jgi:hypothetical protein
MTGPEHYQEAERLLGDASRADGIIVMPNPQAIAAAQVHATLAHAAATAVNDFQGWCAVAIEPERPAVTR